MWFRRVPALSVVLLAISSAFGLPQQHTPPKMGTGIYRGHRVTYQVVNGRLMFDGDIVLDHVAQEVSASHQQGGTLDYRQYLWPKVGSVYQIPYIIDPSSSDTTNIMTAISTYNSQLSGVIQWVPHTSETDYVDFYLQASDTSGEGNSYIGRVGKEQVIGGSGNASVATLLHEMGHATGFWHEQARPDRDSFVTVNLANMISAEYPNSAKQFDDMQPLTLYDWSSIMEYFAMNFTKNGLPVIETIPQGMPLANTVGYSAGDLDAIERLYTSTPSAVTITSNPPGLQVTVDGSLVTTPQTYNWPLRSTHTVSVDSNAQTLNGVTYTYGRWNDDGAATHTITVLPGNGEVAFPASKPAVTVYMASFIQLVPYTMTVYPTGTGTITPSPAPQSYPGVSGVYFTARQQVTLTATPNPGQNFYQYINSPYWLPGGLSINPKTFVVMDDGTPINTTTYFTPTSSPIFTIDSSPHGPNFYVVVDGNYWPAPTSFSPFYNSAWNVGTNHTIAVDNPEYPWSFATRFAFGSWSDGGAVSHSITAPASSTNYTASLDPQYYVSTYANEGCAGSVGVTPASPTGDGFYATGTLLTFTQTPVSPWIFTEWQQNLSGTSNPLNTTISDELVGVADYSTTTTPVTVTSLSPSAAVSGGGAFTLTINGTGFTSQSVVFINNNYRAATFVNSTKLTVAMTSADLATPGGFQVFVQNDPPGSWTCSAYGALPFNVASSPIVKPSVLNLTFSPALVNTTSTAKTVTIKNTGTSAVTLNSEAVNTGDFSIASNTCGATLGAGKTCTVGLTFTPHESGTTAGSLTISDTAPDSPQIVSLTGTGQLPLTLSLMTLAFGTEPVGGTTASKVVTLTNNQSSTLSFAFSTSANYAVSGGGTTCSGSLASKAACNIAITFSPTANGVINGGLTITDGTSFSPQIVMLSGTGSGGAAAPLTFTPASVSFGTQVVGTSSAARTVTVKNVSAGAVTLSSIAASGDFIVAGSGATPCAASLSLNAGASCTMTVTFAPALGASGTVSGAVAVSDNAAVGQQVLDVKGPAALPLTFAPASLTFASQSVASASAPQTVTVTNNLAAAVNLTVSGSGEYSAVAGGPTPCGSSLAGKTSCTFTVTFTPSSVGTRASAIVVSDSATPGVEHLNVTGTGQ